MGRFADVTAVTLVEPAAPGNPARRYAVRLDGAFGFAQALNGGYLLAVLTRAVTDGSPHPHPVATSANFLRVAKPGAAEILVEPRKTGRTAQVSRVTLVQHGQALIDAQVTTGTLDPAGGPDWIGAPPSIPPRAECLTFDPAKQGGANADDQFTNRVELHYDPATMGWLDGRPSGRPEMRAWFRLRDGHPPDPFSLALAVDALPPVALNTGAAGWAPTVELTWHMRAVPAPGWLNVHATGRMVSDGWFDEEVEVWDSAGALVAQSRQLARTGRK
jgi:acyl-CoA thioesterase